MPNDIVLRPRFQLLLNSPKESILYAFEKAKKNPFLVKRMDDHIFIKFNIEHTHFWSPQLHLEIIEGEDENACKIYGLFGPNPTLWTFFIFLHFGVGTLFTILGVWAYSNWTLDRPNGIQLASMALMVVLWITLYMAGREGKKKGKPQMHELHGFMKELLKS